MDVPWNSLKFPHYQKLVLTKTEIVTLLELCRVALLRSSSRALQKQHTGQQLECEEDGEVKASNQICGEKMRQWKKTHHIALGDTAIFKKMNILVE